MEVQGAQEHSIHWQASVLVPRVHRGEANTRTHTHTLVPNTDPVVCRNLQRTGQGYKQIKSLASALSLVRRFMQLLDWLDSLRDLAQAIRERDAFGAVQAAIAATNEVCDDLVTLRKAGAISARVRREHNNNNNTNRIP